MLAHYALRRTCKTIAKTLRRLSKTVSDPKQKGSLASLAISAERLPKVIGDCIEGGKIRKIKYLQEKPSSSTRRKIVESYSVEYASKDSWSEKYLSIILGGLLAFLIVFLAIKLSCCSKCTIPSNTNAATNRTPASVTTKNQHENNQYVLVFGDKLQNDVSLPLQCVEEHLDRDDAVGPHASATNAPK